jgi:small subunit ribosomal protein S15
MRGEQIPTGIVTDLEQIGDYASGSTAEILSGKIANLAAKYGRKPHDTGSPEVQIAIMTERLKGYDRHMVEHKSDINSRRGFLATWHRRRKMLKYLRRTKYETYAYIMKELQLRESDIDSVGLDRTSGTQAARIKKD